MNVPFRKLVQACAFRRKWQKTFVLTIFNFISKFQVIVITHDVDLLDALSRGTQIEHYHKVSRDENGESIVNKTAVSTR